MIQNNIFNESKIVFDIINFLGVSGLDCLDDSAGKILQCICENYSDTQLSVDLISEKVGISVSTLHFICKRKLRLTPRELICVVRMYISIEVIYVWNITIDELSLKCGFLNPKTFRENFKQVFNLLPSEVIILSNKKSLKINLKNKLLKYLQNKSELARSYVE